MDTAGSFLLLFSFVVLIFGVPIIMLAIRLIETLSERRESIRLAEKGHAEDESNAEKKAADGAGEWTPAKHMR
jgi:hypothetical protein